MLKNPCVFVGLGGTGATILRTLYRKMEQKAKSPEEFSNLVGKKYFFLEIDTNTAAANQLEQTNITGSNYWKIYADPKKDVDGLIQGVESFKDWYYSEDYIPKKPVRGAGAQPVYSMVSFFNYVKNNSSEINNWARGIGSSICEIDSSERLKGQGENDVVPVFYISGICGGTGSGLILHVPYLIRHLLQEHITGADQQKIDILNIGIFQTPGATNLVRGLNDHMKANAYASVLTLDNWQSLAYRKSEKEPNQPTSYEFNYSKKVGDVDFHIQTSKTPYDIIYWVGAKTQSGIKLTKEQIPHITTDFIYSAACGSNTANKYHSDFSNSAVSCSYPCVSSENGEKRPQSYGSFMVARLQFPKNNIKHWVSRYVASRWRDQMVDKGFNSEERREILSGILSGSNLDSAESAAQIFKDGKNIILPGWNDTKRDLLSCITSEELTEKSQDYIENVDNLYRKQKLEFNESGEAGIKGGEYAENIIGGMIEFITGASSYSQDYSKGRELRFVLNLEPALRAMLEEVLGRENEQDYTGLLGRKADLTRRLEDQREEIDEVSQRSLRKHLFGNPVKKIANATVIPSLKKYRKNREELLQTECAIATVTQLKKRVVESLTRMSKLLEEMLAEYFVPKGYDRGRGLPAFQSSEDSKSAFMMPVFYKKEWIQDRWLADWKGEPEKKIKSGLHEGKMVKDRYLDLAGKLLHAEKNREGKDVKGPITEAISRLWNMTREEPDISDEALRQSVEPLFEQANKILMQEVAHDIDETTIWDALWLEAEKRSQGSKKVQLDEARDILKEFFDIISPVWRRQRADEIKGIKAKNDPGANFALIVGPSLRDLSSGHKLKGLKLEGLHPNAHVVGFEEEGTKWKSFLLVTQVEHGYPVSRIADIEPLCRKSYEKHERSVGKGGELCLHTDYKYQNQYHPLDFIPRETSEEKKKRQAVVICEYIAEKTPKFFETEDGCLPRIERTGQTGNYTLFTSKAKESIKGRENLYFIFSDQKRVDLFESVKSRIEEWLEKEGGTETTRENILKDILRWTQKRARNEKNENYRALMEEDVSVMQIFAEDYSL